MYMMYIYLRSNLSYEPEEYEPGDPSFLLLGVHGSMLSPPPSFVDSPTILSHDGIIRRKLCTSACTQASLFLCQAQSLSPPSPEPCDSTRFMTLDVWCGLSFQN